MWWRMNFPRQGSVCSDCKTPLQKGEMCYCEVKNDIRNGVVYPRLKERGLKKCCKCMEKNPYGS
jgi:hypothetical protein